MVPKGKATKRGKPAREWKYPDPEDEEDLRGCSESYIRGFNQVKHKYYQQQKKG